ncbi:pyridoxine 5'-phosphate synthase [Roseomonas sp. CCTCC AB2023176]|uniref:pyridoxine 5'-phosphate synthase n=1 Tax=Roseomonas sp. CCTCC AB2023176 TaxID=3342640 RepID=UPI0035D93EFA
MTPLRLSINIDHVATLRNARAGTHPDPLDAARAVLEAGADGITVHLREDRRHIRDADVERLRAALDAPLNLEMAATEEMVAIAERLRPADCCIVPEGRHELTTEGGLDIPRAGAFLAEAVRRLSGAGIRVSIFIEADRAQVEAAVAIGAAAIEFHTGTYADAAPDARAPHLRRIAEAAPIAAAAGLACHAGHGLAYDSIAGIAAIPDISEVSIGHFLVGQAVFEGLPAAVRRMKALIAEAREARRP